MLRKAANWLQGYLYVQMYGNMAERFINLCCNKRIKLWNLTHINGYYIYQINAADYKKIKPIVKKTGVHPKILNKVGFPFYWNRYKKKKGFFIGIVVSMLLVYILSLFIWDIQILGGSKYTPEAMLHFLKENNIYTGMQKNKVNCQEIEETIRLEYKDISWVSAEIKGTRLILKLTETNMPVPAKSTALPSHMVATKNAIIKGIVTRSGTPLVKEGDVVKKGDILVSGILTVKGDFDEILRYQPVVADATIKSKSYYDYYDSISLNYMEKKFTKREKKFLYFTLLEKKFFLNKPIYFYDKYDIIVNEYTFHVTDTFYLPIQYGVIRIREYYDKKRLYTKEEAVGILKAKLQRYLDCLSEKDVFVTKENVKITIDNNSCIAAGRIFVEEPAWEYRKVQENEWRIEQTDEYN